MACKIFLWYLNETVEVRNEIDDTIVKISNIDNHLYVLTKSNNLYYGVVQNNNNLYFVELDHVENLKLVDIDSCKEYLYIVNTEGLVFKCNAELEIINEVILMEDYICTRGHGGKKYKVKVAKISAGEYGLLFITELGHLWASGNMPQIGIYGEIPRRVNFFIGRLIYSINVGYDFAIAIVSKQKNDEVDSDEDVFAYNCPQCLSASQLTSPASQNSLSEICPLGVKVQGSYDIETTSTSSKNDSSISSNDRTANSETDDKADDLRIEKNIIFRNTEAAREFLTRQISRMSSAGEEYLVECTEKPTRIIKENMTNVASFVYEGVKTVGDKVVTLSRHVSGSSECNSVIENDVNIPRTISKDEFMWSLSQCTSEKDLSDKDVNDHVRSLLKMGSTLLNCEIWTWGNILYGQLGTGDIIKRERPMIITKLSNIGVQKISVQGFHASVVTLDGRTFIWGKNNYNQVTLDNNCDQSSPKLYTTSKDERITDVVCGAHFTILLNNNQEVFYYGINSKKHINLYSNKSSDIPVSLEIPVFGNLVSSKQYTVLNVKKASDEVVCELLLKEQKLLEEMLCVQVNVIKPLQKKNTNSSYASLLENLCCYYVDILHFLAVSVHSLIQYENNMISLCDITVIRNLEEYIFIYRNYISTTNDIISIDGFRHITKIIEVPQSLCKLRGKKDKTNEEQLISSLLLEPVDHLSQQLTIMQAMAKKTNHQKIEEFNNHLEHFVENQKALKQEAEITKEFWQNSGKTVDFLKALNRRLIRDSHKYPLFLQNAGRFSNHWFILFSDLFVHMNGSTPNLHNLATIWLDIQQDETSQQCQITLKMPEETLLLYTNEPEAKIEWFHALQIAIKNALDKPSALQPPCIRSGSYTFTKNSFFKDAKYTGRWLNAKMHGFGKVEWPDGKSYTGQFNQNQLSGYGSMTIPNVGIYEGQWKENQQNGYGTLTYTNTDIYKGHFKDGLPHGHGFLRKGNFMSNSASFYIGEWVMGTKSGYGVIDDILAGEKYIGNWTDDKKHGNGLIITSDGIYYEGVFHQDSLTGQGIMILEDGTHYEGEFKGTGILSGKGVLTLPTGHLIEGNLNGSFNEGIKISNGVFSRNCENPVPKSFETLCTPLSQKWRALFKHCYQVLGIPEQNLNKNGIKALDTQKIWQNVAVALSNASTLSKTKMEKKHQNCLNNLDFIPPFGRDKLDVSTFTDTQQYLTKAFESPLHPLGILLNNLMEAYSATYGGRAHPLLLSHAISELHYITKRLYEIVTSLFPALPSYENECYLEKDDGEEIVNYQSLLYPLILPKVHHPLFTLFTLKNEQQERQYKKTLLEWNKQSDYTLMSFLSVHQKFFKTEEQFSNPPVKNQLFLDSIETLQQIKSTFSPTEKLIVIRQTVEKMTPVAQEILGQSYVWNMDDLFPIFLYVVVRSRIPDLGSELDFIDNFMDPSLESGELGIMFTTLKACYQQILKEKSSSF